MTVQGWRRIRTALWVGSVVAGVAIAAFERWRPEDAQARWGALYRRALEPVLVPVAERTQRTVDVARRFRRLWRAELENERLRGELTRLQVERRLLEEQLGAVSRLSGMEGWGAPPELELIPVNVIGLGSNDQSTVLVIDRGSADGVAPHDPMVAPGGVVGLVRDVSPHSARVQAIVDPASALGVIVLETRARGVAYGRGQGRPLEFIPEDESQPIRPGDTLITSGFERSAYPKGLPVATIRRAATSTQGLAMGEADPVVAFDAVEEGLVIVPRSRRLAATGPPEPGGEVMLGRYEVRAPRGRAAAEAPTSSTLGPLPVDVTIEPDRPSSGSLLPLDALPSTPPTTATHAVPAARGGGDRP